MALLQDKKILITGLLSHRSIAYGIAKAAHREGAQLAFTYQGEDIKARVVDLARDFGAANNAAPVLPCDVSDDGQITKLFEDLRSQWDGLDGLVHSIAFAPREALKGDLLEGLSREAFRIAHDVSSYSLAALAKAALPMMENRHWPKPHCR